MRINRLRGTVADRPIRWRSNALVRPNRSSTAIKCAPRSPAAKLWISSITTNLRWPNSRAVSTLGEMSITSRDSGVVIRMWAGSAKKRWRSV